jgi:hypothetical protein
MKSSFKKLIVVIIAVCTLITTKAQIVYTDVNPDQIFADTGSSVYHLDLNNDGINDFDIRDSSKNVSFSGHCSGLETNNYITITPLQNNNSVLSDANSFPYALDLNDAVAGSSSLWSTAKGQILIKSDWSCVPPPKHCTFMCSWHLMQDIQGLWTTGSDKYVGLKLVNGNNTYYGWIRLSVNVLPYDSTATFTIKDYAFNSTPGASILGGQKTNYNWIVVAALSSTNSQYALQYCPQDNVSVTYAKLGTFNAGNIFTAQLSDSNGSFAHAKAIGSIQSTGEGIINATIPANTSPGAKYRIRVVSSSPLIDSLYANKSGLIVGAGISALTGYQTAICAGNATELVAPGGYTYQWLKNGKPLQGNMQNSLVVDSTSKYGTGNYSCIVNGVCGPDTSNIIVVTVNALPKVSITASGATTFCAGGSVTLNDTMIAKGLTYQWYQGDASDPSDSIPGATKSFYAADTSNWYALTATDKKGCTGKSPSISVNVPEIPKAYISIIGNNGDTSFCQGDSVLFLVTITNWDAISYQYQWKRNGTNISGATLDNYYAKNAGSYTCKVSDMCGNTVSPPIKLTTKQCLVNDAIANNEKIVPKDIPLAIAPNPFSNSTIISFSLQQAQKVSVIIYDIDGRLIKTLADAEMQAGTHQIVWNAKDEKGNAVSAGIYLLRMQAGNYSETKKLLIVK